MQFIPSGAMPEQPACAFFPAVSAPIPATPVPPPGPTLSQALVRTYPGSRPGAIDIDLRNGICLAVDSYVNEKALHWDGTGLCLFTKKLEQKGLRWPVIQAGVIPLRRRNRVRCLRVWIGAGRMVGVARLRRRLPVDRTFRD